MLGDQFGKIGILLMSLGLLVLYYDGYRISITAPSGYQFYEHPQIYIPIIGMFIAFTGTYLFIKHFRKEGKIV